MLKSGRVDFFAGKLRTRHLLSSHRCMVPRILADLNILQKRTEILCNKNHQNSIGIQFIQMYAKWCELHDLKQIKCPITHSLTHIHVSQHTNTQHRAHAHADKFVRRMSERLNAHMGESKLELIEWIYFNTVRSLSLTLYDINPLSSIGSQTSGQHENGPVLNLHVYHSRSVLTATKTKIRTRYM